MSVTERSPLKETGNVLPDTASKIPRIAAFSALNNNNFIPQVVSPLFAKTNNTHQNNNKLASSSLPIHNKVQVVKVLHLPSSKNIGSGFVLQSGTKGPYEGKQIVVLPRKSNLPTYPLKNISSTKVACDVPNEHKQIVFLPRKSNLPTYPLKNVQKFTSSNELVYDAPAYELEETVTSGKNLSFLPDPVVVESRRASEQLLQESKKCLASGGISFPDVCELSSPISHFSNDCIDLSKHSENTGEGPESDVNFKENKRKGPVKFSHKKSTQNKENPIELLDSDSDLSDEDFLKKKRKFPRLIAPLDSFDKPDRKIPKKPTCRKSSEERKVSVEALEEQSKTDKSFSKVHDVLPTLFDYIITSVEDIPGSPGTWKAVIRANIQNKVEAELWLEEYQVMSSCDFRIRDTKKENSPRLVWKKIYRCHHNIPQGTVGTHEEKGIQRFSKNTDCPVTLRITIKNKEMKWSSDDLLQKYPCEILLRNNHNHAIVVKEALRRRRPTKAIEKKFSDLFAKGHSPSSAVETHKFDLQVDSPESYLVTSADRSKCPDVKWASRLYYKIFKSVYGPSEGEGLLTSIKDYVDKYNEMQGSKCAVFQTVNERDLIIAICTPLMKRVHTRLRSAGEMMFVDSGGTMDAHNTRVFLMLCPSIAGGLPVGIILVSSEAEVVLKQGFDLLKTLLPEGAFGGRGQMGPKIIMTDDSASERKALQSEFSLAVLILCLFHVLQAFWRYIWDSNHKVASEDRAEVYYAFRETAYSPDAETFSKLYDELMQKPAITCNAQLQKHLEDLKVREKEWALHHRTNLVTRGHNTNNYDEAGMLVLKDKVCHRKKAFSIVQLMDFIVVGFNNYLVSRIVDVVNDRDLNVRRTRYFIDPEKLLPLKCFPTSRSNFYLVKNTSRGTEYIVNMLDEVCSCPEGQNGKPCKHECAVVKEFKIQSTQIRNFVHSDVKIKEDLLYVAYGPSVKIPSNWFASLHDENAAQGNSVEVDGTKSSFEIQNNESSLVHADSEHLLLNGDNQLHNIVSQDPPGDELIDKVANDLHDMVESWVTLLKSRPDVFLKPCEAMVKQNSVMDTRDAQLTSAMHMFGKWHGPPTVKKSYGGRNIPVNSTSVARRTAYLGGRNVQLTGRPSNAMKKKMQEHNFSTRQVQSSQPAWHRKPSSRPKAPHSLSECVSRGVALGKTHQRK